MPTSHTRAALQQVNEGSVASDRELKTTDVQELREFLADIQKATIDASNTIAMRSYRLKKKYEDFKRRYDRAGGEDMEGYFQPGSDTVSSIVAATTEGSSKAVRSLDGLRDYIDSALQRLKRLK